ncbi:hypothetical protein PybrP1_005877 [[Pythium] brassicae (nom. inval.)]|nr:hypothetical protein PybrP1_005877 [[Pythium] brassicae (nom. inval.)]
MVMWRSYPSPGILALRAGSALLVLLVDDYEQKSRVQSRSFVSMQLVLAEAHPANSDLPQIGGTRPGE